MKHRCKQYELFMCIQWGLLNSELIIQFTLKGDKVGHWNVHGLTCGRDTRRKGRTCKVHKERSEESNQKKEPLCLVAHYHVTLYSGYEVHSLPTVLTQKKFTNLSPKISLWIQVDGSLNWWWAANTKLFTWPPSQMRVSLVNMIKYLSSHILLSWN